MHEGEVAYNGRQQVGRDRRDHADPQPPHQLVARGACQVTQIVDGAQDIADALDEFLAEIGQANFAPASLEDLRAQRFLQFLDLHRQGGLGDRAGLRRAPEMAVPRQCLDVAELFERQIYHKYRLS